MKLIFVFRILLAFIIVVLASSQQLRANEINLFNLTLEELLEFKIESAGKRPEKIKEIPASVIIITREDISGYGYTSLTDVLEQVPGFYNIYSYEGVSGNFGIRGFWNPRSQNSNVAILVNGVNQARHDIRSNPLAKITLPVEAIDRIEIIRGPMSVMYGNGASFGVINIVTNQSRLQEGENLVELNLSVGDFQKKKIAFRYEYGSGDLKLVANTGAYTSDPIEARLIDMIDSSKIPTLPFLGVQDPQSYTFKNKLELDSRYLDVSIENKPWVFDFSYNWSEVEKFLLLPPVADGTLEGNENKMLHVGYRGTFNPANDYSIDYTFNDYFRDQDFDALTPDFEGYNFVEYQSHNLEFVVNTQLTQSISLTSGLDYRRMVDSLEFTNAPLVGFVNESVSVDKRSTSSIFAQANYRYSDHLSLVAGYRYEEIGEHLRSGIEDGGTANESSFGGLQGGQQNYTPRLAAVYHLNKNHTLKIKYGEASKIVTDRFDAEDTKTSEIIYIYSHKDTLISTSLFQNNLENLVVDTLELQGDGSVVNRTRQTGAINTEGVEFISLFNVAENLDAEFSFTYQDSDDKLFVDIDPAYSPELIANFKMRYQLGETSFALNARYVDEIETQFDVSIDNGDGSFGNRIGSATPNFTIVDFNFRKENFWNDLYLNVKISNLFDQRIRYPNNQQTSEFLDKGVIGSPRSILVSTGVSF